MHGGGLCSSERLIFLVAVAMQHDVAGCRRPHVTLQARLPQKVIRLCEVLTSHGSRSPGPAAADGSALRISVGGDTVRALPVLAPRRKGPQ